MTLAQGDAFVVGDIFSFQQAERIRSNWRAAAAVSNPQAGSLWSKTTNDKLYHRGAGAYIELYSGVTDMYKWKKGGDKASAAALDISDLDGNYFDVTGVDAITSITASGRTGTIICLHFDGILVFTHHATNLILPSGANITTAAGDEAILIEYDTGKWRCICYTKADGTAIVGSGGVTATTGAWSKSIGSGGDYADWATMIAAMPDMIAHAVTITIEKGTTLSEICELRNKHGLTAAAAITVQSEGYYPLDTDTPPTADSATATTLRDAVLAAEGFGNDYFVGCWIQIIHGTGTDNGLVPITDYVDATGDVVVASWPGTQPDATSRYIIVGAQIDGGSSRAQCFNIYYNTVPITFIGIGMKDNTAWTLSVQYSRNFMAKFCAVENSGDWGVFNRLSKVNLTSCGVVNCAATGVYMIGGSGYIWQCGVSENGAHGVKITDHCFCTVVTNFGAGNADWGCYALTSGQADVSGTEIAGASGNHSDAGGAGTANADQASAY